MFRNGFTKKIKRDAERLKIIQKLFLADIRHLGAVGRICLYTQPP